MNEKSSFDLMENYWQKNLKNVKKKRIKPGEFSGKTH